MQALLAANANCVDCNAQPIEAADILHGVFLCSPCARIHRDELKFPVKSISDPFLAEEISFLAEKGNALLNSQLCKTIAPWFATPCEFPFLAVRLHWAKAKYLSRAFAIEPIAKPPRTDLNLYWFYLDEVSEEIPVISGPVSREDLKKLKREGETLLGDSYVWHPVLGKKWVPLDKLYAEIIEDGTKKEDAVIYDTYEQRQELLSQPLPHLRGYLDITVKSKTQRKWVILRRNYLNLNTYNYPSSSDQSVPLDYCDISLLEVGPRLSIRIQHSDLDFLFNSAEAPELLEWFNALRCTKLLLSLGRMEDLLETPIDSNELHICNVRNSRSYMGEKRKEGFLRKEGSSWKSIKTRWFTLRTQGLFYYAAQTDKSFRGSLQLHGARVSSVEQYKYPNHFVIKTDTDQKTLHLWAEDEVQREAWVEAIKEVANSLGDDCSVYQN